jgi:hypothetical protein
MGPKVQHDPDGKLDDMNDDEPHFACMGGDDVTDSGRHGAIRQRSSFFLADLANVSVYSGQGFHDPHAIVASETMPACGSV